MKSKKKYIVEKWFKVVEEFKTKDRAIKNSRDWEGNEKYKDIKIFEVEESSIEIQLNRKEKI